MVWHGKNIGLGWGWLKGKILNYDKNSDVYLFYFGGEWPLFYGGFKGRCSISVQNIYIEFYIYERAGKAAL